MINTSQILQINDVSRQCGETCFFRGRKYFAENKVLSVKLINEAPDLSQVTGVVAGTRPNIYRQDIDLVATRAGGVTIKGRCSCPMETNCKHVAAVCLAFITQRQNDPKALAPQEAITPYLDWLTELQQAGDAASVANEAERAEWIAYLLRPGSVPGELNIYLKITRITKGGTIGKGRKVTHEHVASPYTQGAYIQGNDKEICQLISAQEYASSSWANHIPLNGTLGYQILTLVVETGRCFWRDTQGQKLHTGDLRKLHIDWDVDARNQRRPSLEIDAGGLPLLTQPPLYLDSHEGLIGPLESGNINAEQIRLLINAPSIPDKLTGSFSEHLIHDFPDLPLPPPAKVDVTEIRDTKPVPCVILHTEGQISLYFEYDGHHIQPDPDTNPLTLKQAGNILRIHRDLEQERNAHGLLDESGFQITVPPLRKNCRSYTDVMTLDGRNNATLWYDFLEFILPELEQQGWRILQDDDFRLTFEEADDWQANINEKGSDNDWFELRFDINIDGKKIPLLPIVSEILAEHDVDNLPETLIVGIDAQRFLKLPSARLKPVINTLFELFDQHPTNANGAMELSRLDAPRLNQLEAQTDSVWKGGKALRQFGEKLQDFNGIQAVTPPAGLYAELRGYQQEGLNWLQFLCEYQLGGILADDMGLGKTIQALAHLQVEKEAGRLTQPALIVAPTSLMSNWRREAERYTPDLRVLVLHGHGRKKHFKDIPEYDLVLTTYPLLPRDGKILGKNRFHSLILDEAQIIKNPKSQAAIIIRSLHSQHRLCLTGTPMENHLGELWSLFDFLMPRFLGNAKTFTQVYRTPIEKNGDHTRREALVKRISPFMLRRNKTEVAAELPPKTEILRSVPLGDQQATLYESIRLTMEKKVRDSIAAKGLGRSHITILDALLKLRQTCCDPRLLSLKQAEDVNESAKLDMLMEMLPEQLEEGRRILLFSQFTRMLGLIETELKNLDIPYTKLTGQTRKRDAAIDEFTSGRVNLFLISLKAGGVGLNLTEADTVIHYDPWWNPAVETQATDRAHRIGQSKPVFVYKLVTENSVEEKILAMQEKKRALADGIYRSEDQQDEPKLSADDLKELFTPIA